MIGINAHQSIIMKVQFRIKKIMKNILVQKLKSLTAMTLSKRKKKQKLIEPSRTVSLKNSVPQWLKSTAFAHRGLFNPKDQNQIPENSLLAFQTALEMGYGIELDVHLTSDGEVVVFHDETLERMTKLLGSVRSKTLLELTQTQLLASNQKIPTLASVLALVQGKVPILVEVKNNGHKVGPLEKKVGDLLSAYQGPYTIQSFNPFTLVYFAKHYPSMIRGLLTYDFPEKGKLNLLQLLLLKKMLLLPLCKPSYIGYEVNALLKPWPLLLKRVRHQMPLLAWTIRTEHEFKIASQIADQVIFEEWDQRDLVQTELQLLIQSKSKAGAHSDIHPQ
jgi:glycerophosphoryl diester phosphodiesterase